MIAIGLGPSRGADGRWHFDLRHGPPRGRLPMAFFVRAVGAPVQLGRQRPLEPVGLDEVDVPQLDGYGYSPLARPVLVFVEKSAAPVLPDAMEAGATAAGEQLYWRLVSTDSCEAVHCGALLVLRQLICERRVQVIDEASGEAVVDFGMINAKRVRPFTRHVMVERASVRVRPAPPATTTGPRDGGSTPPKPQLQLDEAALPRLPSYGGALHQLILMRTAAGRELLMDFTGAQYGVDDRLAATDTPCWRCAVGGEAARGYELIGSVAPFSSAQLDPSILDTNGGVHAIIANWVRDSALGVLAHRRAHALPLVAP